ncbi:hypothetical protein AT269_17440 [Bacillus cereus]|nr:hypothetical protein AT269_17440 [Bacillus cereus]
MAIPFNRNQHYDNRYLSWALFHGDDILCERYYVITYNEEMNCYIHDPIYISRIKPVINADLQNSKQVTSSDVNQLSIKEKMKEKVAKIFEYYL